ncbi:unnamed protein product [Orchesella dallaii]|uniref:CARD domain-containing protein n=1 Tax=Orchesella dallaii TaxID=48710 RepID=A0ABP1PSP7_9HEXA
MEDWQKEIIKKNLDKLITLTTCRTKLLAKLEASGILSDDDTAILEELGHNRLKQTSEFYKIMLTRTNGFERLLEALRETRQSGAADLLVSGTTKYQGGAYTASPLLTQGDTRFTTTTGLTSGLGRT